MDAVIETLEDAQSGQLHYLITGNERFLTAYQQAHAAVDEQLNRVAQSIDADPAQHGRLMELRRAVDDKMAELAAAIERPSCRQSRGGQKSDRRRSRPATDAPRRKYRGGDESP